MNLSTSNLTLKLLGGNQIFLNDVALRELTAAKSRALLFYLAVTGRPASRDALAGLLWPEMPDADAKTNLRQALNKLNKLLPNHLLITRQEVGLLPDAAVSLDTAEFESHLSSRRLPTSGRISGEEIEQLRSAADLYQGEFLDGFFLPDAILFEEWVLLERERLRSLALQALDTLSNYYTSRRETRTGLLCTGRLLQLEPWREETHQQMMRLLAWDGQVTAALAQYNTCKKMLDEALGIEPLPSTTALYERILALRQAPRDNLPLEPTPFVGRNEQLATLTDWLHDPHCRLLTIIGPGGVGKTRLALQAAAQQRGLFLDGVYFVELAGLERPEQLAPAIAAAVVYTFAGQPSPDVELKNYLRPKELLLVLDNFEHLLVDSSQVAVRLLANLLQTAADLKLLITSRQRLNLVEEWVFELDGLPYPTDAADPYVEQYECIQLFAQVARRSGGRFDMGAEKSAVIQICQLVQGLPLAVYLAAALLPIRTGAQIATEIATNLNILATAARNVPRRQQSIRATLDYSWSLLDKRERSLLMRLSVFRGGFDDAAARAVAGGAGATLRTLAALVDNSLLRRNADGRYELHELVRHFAAEHLSNDPLALSQSHEGHSNHYLALAREQGEALNGPQMKVAVALIGRERDNVRLAWQWAIEQATSQAEDSVRAEDGIRIAIIGQSCVGLTRFYLASNQYIEGESLLGAAVEWLETRIGISVAADERLQPLLAQLLTSLARLFMVHRRYKEALQTAEKALALAARHGVVELIIRNHLCWGGALYQSGDYAAARPHIEQGIRLAQEAALPYLEAMGWQYQGGVEYFVANYTQAAANYERSLAYYEVQRPSFPRQRAVLTNNLGNVHLRLGNFEQAKANYERSRLLRQDAEAGQIGGAVTINNLGLVAVAQGRYLDARGHYEQALRHYRQTGNRQGEGMVLGNLGELYRQLGCYERAKALFEQDLTIMQEIGRRGRRGTRLANLALICCHLGDLEQANRYGREAITQAESQGEQNTLAVALMFLGHIQAASAATNREQETALATYQRTWSLYQLLGQEKFALETAAAIAHILLNAGQLTAASNQIEPILHHLQTGNLEGTYNPFQVYLTCYQVLTAAQDGRAPALLNTAYHLLQEQATHIDDEALRHAFLGNVPAHRAIAAERMKAEL